MLDSTSKQLRGWASLLPFDKLVKPKIQHQREVQHQYQPRAQHQHQPGIKSCIQAMQSRALTIDMELPERTHLELLE